MAHLIRILRSLSFLRLFCTGDKMGYTKRLIRKSVAAQWVFTLREDVVRSEGRTSCTSVLQEIITLQAKSLYSCVLRLFTGFFLFFTLRNIQYYFPAILETQQKPNSSGKTQISSTTRAFYFLICIYSIYLVNLVNPSYFA